MTTPQSLLSPWPQRMALPKINRRLWKRKIAVRGLLSREVNAGCSTLAPVMYPSFPSPIKAHCDTLLGIIALRDQLQRETLRRKLVEEACENERRRRKLAEDTLDDARREYDEPLVVPAMMDAFERIAQLTGDALMAVDDQKMV